MADDANGLRKYPDPNVYSEDEEDHSFEPDEDDVVRLGKAPQCNHCGSRRGWFATLKGCLKCYICGRLAHEGGDKCQTEAGTWRPNNGIMSEREQVAAAQEARRREAAAEEARPRAGRAQRCARRAEERR